MSKSFSAGEPLVLYYLLYILCVKYKGEAVVRQGDEADGMYFVEVSCCLQCCFFVPLLLLFRQGDNSLFKAWLGLQCPMGGGGRV